MRFRRLIIGFLAFAVVSTASAQWTHDASPTLPLPGNHSSTGGRVGIGVPYYWGARLRLAEAQGVLTDGPFLLTMGSTTATWWTFRLDTSNNLHLDRQGNSGWVEGFVFDRVNGRLGIGAAEPKTPLHVYSTATTDAIAGFGPDPSVGVGPSFNVGYAGASYARSVGFMNVRADALATAPNPSMRFLTADVERMIITNTGAVGIGTIPTAGLKLHVDGSAHFDGMVTGTNIRANFQDLAEWVPATTALEPGTVVILNRDKDNEVMASSTAYDTTVAGVVSAQPGISLGIEGEGMEQIATTGRVKVRVDARKVPVRVGDLLVTSDTPGMAMRSQPMDINGRPFHQPGTILGKALQSLDGGVGEILVLLSMQ